MIRIDDRTLEQKKTLTLAVVGTDPSMSYWGDARGGLSYAAWACTPNTVNAVERWVKSRGDMKRVRVIDLRTYKPKGAVHLHIYVAQEEE